MELTPGDKDWIDTQINKYTFDENERMKLLVDVLINQSSILMESCYVPSGLEGNKGGRDSTRVTDVDAIIKTGMQ